MANCPYQSPRDSKDEEYNAPMFVGDTNKFDTETGADETVGTRQMWKKGDRK